MLFAAQGDQIPSHLPHGLHQTVDLHNRRGGYNLLLPFIPLANPRNQIGGHRQRTHQKCPYPGQYQSTEQHHRATDNDQKPILNRVHLGNKLFGGDHRANQPIIVNGRSQSDQIFLTIHLGDMVAHTVHTSQIPLIQSLGSNPQHGGFGIGQTTQAQLFTDIIGNHHLPRILVGNQLRTPVDDETDTGFAHFDGT